MFGWILAIAAYVIGLILMLLVITAPIGLGLMEYGKFLFLPFTHYMVKKDSFDNKSMTAYKMYAGVLGIVYILVFGIWLFISGIFAIIGYFVSIIGIPCAIVLAKSLGTLFNPVGKVCVTKEIADEMRRRAAAAKLDQTNDKTPQINDKRI